MYLILRVTDENESRITCSDWNLKLHDMGIGLVECRRTEMEMNEVNAIGQKS